MSTTTKLTCPYCKKRFIREDLVSHLGYHRNILPEGFTPLRMAYHVANRKDVKYRRACRICHLGTEWDEKKGRYDFLCKKKSCHDAWVKQMEKNMHGKAGKFRPTSTPEGLEKMLAGRHISGRYKWSDGTEKVYTGSYEKKALYFFDNVCRCKSEEIQCPGPTLKYTMDGKEHWYISDMYYIPYNLIIEVKDGGDHPNTNPSYANSRRKTLAKEEYIVKHTDYNYLRLTDNDFSQVLDIFAQLKLRLNEKNPKKRRVVHINESTPTMSLAPMMGNNDIIVVNYNRNNVFSDESEYAIADSPKFDSVFVRNSIGELKKTDKKIFENCIYTPYMVKNVKDSVAPVLSQNLNRFVSDDFIYETVFHHKPFSKDQIVFENDTEEIIDFYQEQKNIEQAITESIQRDKYGMSFSDRYRKDFRHWGGVYAKLARVIDSYMDSIGISVPFEMIGDIKDYKDFDMGRKKSVNFEFEMDINDYISFKKIFSPAKMRDYINTNSAVRIEKIGDINRNNYGIVYANIVMESSTTQEIIKEESICNDIYLEMFGRNKTPSRTKQFINAGNEWLKKQGQ